MEIISTRHWKRPGQDRLKRVSQATEEMMVHIEAKGDAAINSYSMTYDGFQPKFVALQPFETYPLTAAEQQAIRHAAERIQRFCEAQMAMYGDVFFSDDCGSFGHKVIPMDSMAAYIPGGRFPLISTALMTLIPAKVAGVKRRVALSPSDHPALLAAASLAGATQLLQVGGAQAIGAAGFGYNNLKSVDMVVGPGNAYVNAAKAWIQSRIKIDTLAGPSELLILADSSANIEWICLDMLAQAEHDPQALSVLCCENETLLQQVGLRLETYAKQHQAQSIGAVQLVHAPTKQDMINLSNRMAPEHLHLHTQPNYLDSDALKHYGSLFIGPLSAVALGDYCSGPNHTLPTSGYAHMKGGLHVGDFLKIVTIQQVHRQGMELLGPTGVTLANLEGLSCHAKSLVVRMEPTKDT